MKGFLRLTLLACLVALLSACFPTKPAAKAPQNKVMTPSHRQQQLKQVKAWQVSGAIAIRTREKAQSASVKWRQQSQSTYTISLFGPLGVGNTIITGKPGQVTLTTSENRQYSARSSEALLKEQTGWQIPISNLYYWVRGLPAPGGNPQVTYDKFQHIKTLRQQGWNISYQRYTAIRGIDLPSKMLLSNGQITAKLIINRWQIL